MDEKKNTAQEWLKIATKGIRFRPDRRAAEAELREHLEDKTADMARIFHIEGAEVEREALKRMGDPEEIGKALAKLHKPWLGYLWLASKIACCILVPLALLYLMVLDYHGDAVLHGTSYEPPAAVESIRTELGGYTFRIVCAQVRDEDDLRVVVRISSPRFWERIATPDSCMPMVTVGGKRLSPTANKELGRKTREKMERVLTKYVEYIKISKSDYKQIKGRLQTFLEYPESELALERLNPDQAPRAGEKDPAWIAEAERSDEETRTEEPEP